MFLKGPDRLLFGQDDFPRPGSDTLIRISWYSLTIRLSQKRNVVFKLGRLI
jgi:hypothetical protein